MPLYPSIVMLAGTVITGVIVYYRHKNGYERRNDDGSIATFIVCILGTLIFGLAHFAN